jgi:hypothetical protein
MGDDIKEIKRPTIDIGSIADDTSTFTISIDGLDHTYASPGLETSYTTTDFGWTGTPGCYVDTDLVESNPTCKALWDQFLYVYEMIKSDKENNEEKDDISF